jgi:Fe-S-cluster containining protein
VQHKQVEQEEEFITNKLMKRLEQLKKEKQVLANEVEQEEEFLTNTLQKRLEKVRIASACPFLQPGTGCRNLRPRVRMQSVGTNTSIQDTVLCWV